MLERWGGEVGFLSLDIAVGRFGQALLHKGICGNRGEGASGCADGLAQSIIGRCRVS